MTTALSWSGRSVLSSFGFAKAIEWKGATGVIAFTTEAELIGVYAMLTPPSTPWLSTIKIGSKRSENCRPG